MVNIMTPTAHFCYNMQYLWLRETLTSIGDFSFWMCSSLPSVYLPADVSEIGVGAFENCTSMKSIQVDANNPYFTAQDGILYSKDTTVLYACPTGKTGDCYIPENVKRIADGAFFECMGVENLYFYGNAPELGLNALNYCYWNDDNNLVYAPLPLLTIRYLNGTSGWTTPTWNGYPTAIWGNTPQTSTFTDVSQSAWYADSVNYVVENGLMNGMGKNEFRPEEAMTRAMLVTVLWRYAGSPAEGENTFNDLTQDWYVQAVAWASSNGIVNGYPDGTFKPDEKVTREQLATIVFRYCNTVGIDTSVRADLTAFPDGGKVSSYAEDAISWAVAVGLVTGITYGSNPTAYLEPQTSATRAQVATILMRFIENVAK